MPSRRDAPRASPNKRLNARPETRTPIARSGDPLRDGRFASARYAPRSHDRARAALAVSRSASFDVPPRARPLARGWAPPGERLIRDARARAMTVFAPPVPRPPPGERDDAIANPRFARAPSGRTIRFASRGAPSSSSSRARPTPRPPPRPKLPPPGADPALAEKENANVARAAKAYGDHYAGAEARARVLTGAFDGNRPRTPPLANEPERRRASSSSSRRKPPLATRPDSRERETDAPSASSPPAPTASPFESSSPTSSSDGSPRALDASAPVWAPGSAALDMWEKPAGSSSRFGTGVSGRGPRRFGVGAGTGGTRRAWSADASPYAASLTGTLPSIRGVGDASSGSKRARARRLRASSSSSLKRGSPGGDDDARADKYREEAELWESRAAVLTQEREALREECAAKDGELLVLRERVEALESAARRASPARSCAGSSGSPSASAREGPSPGTGSPGTRRGLAGGGIGIGFALSPEFSPPVMCAFGPPTVDDSPPRWMSGSRAGAAAAEVGSPSAETRDPLKMTFSRYTVGGNITDDEESDEDDAKAEPGTGQSETASEESAPGSGTVAPPGSETARAPGPAAPEPPASEPSPPEPSPPEPTPPSPSPSPRSSPSTCRACLEGDLPGVLAERDRLAADVATLEEALAAARDDKSDLAARLAFARLDADRDGLIGIDELLRAEAFASYGQAVVERVHAVWDYGRGDRAVAGKFSEEDWTTLRRFQERRADADAARFWFRVADVDGDGVIGAHDVRWMYDAVWKDEATCVTLRDFTAQIFDMAGTTGGLARRGGATLRDVRNSKLASGIFGLLCNHNDMLLRRSTAEFSDSDVPM